MVSSFAILKKVAVFLLALITLLAGGGCITINAPDKQGWKEVGRSYADEFRPARQAPDEHK